MGAIELRLLDQVVQIEGPGEFLADVARRFEPNHDRCEDFPSDGVDLRIRVESRPLDVSADRARYTLTTDPPGRLDRMSRAASVCPSELAGALNRWAVTSTSAYYTFHAAAVCREGRGILLPAASRHGKSTLTAALLTRGFDFLSDEVGALGASSGRLVGYPRALFLRRDVLAILGIARWDSAARVNGDEMVLRPDELGGKRCATGAEVFLVVAPAFLPGAQTRIERMRPGPTVMALLEASCAQPRFKVRGIDLVIDLARRTPSFRLEYGDLETAVDAIERTFLSVSRGSE